MSVTPHRVRGCRELALTFAIDIVSQTSLVSLEDWYRYYALMFSHVPEAAMDDEALIAALQKGLDEKKAQ